MKKLFTLFSLAMLTMSAWGANTYVKVTSIDQLEAGQKYILVNEDASVALGAITGTSTNFGSANAITIADGVIDIEGTDALEMTLGSGSNDVYGNPTWTFDLGSGSHYICWTSGNSLQTVNNPSPVNAMWYATLTDDGIVLTNKADNTRKLQYNAGAPRFACYTSNQKPAVLYMQGVPGDDGIANLNEANGLEDGDNFTFAGDVVVTLCNNGYLFLRDESGYGMISGVEDTFANGEVLTPGWSATKTSDNGWVKFTDAADLSASGETNAALAAAIEPYSVDESMLNAYVVIKNLAPSFMPARSYKLPDGTRISKTDVLWPMNADASTVNYNVYGVICKVGDVLMINPIAFEDYVEEPTFLRGDVNDDSKVDITDVTALIDYLLNDTNVNLDAADCNQDGIVDITDLTVLIDYLLNDIWP